MVTTDAGARAVVVLTAVLLAAAGCAGAFSPTRARDRSVVQSNVLRADYAGSAACEPCHTELYAEFMKSPMHNMTRHADGAVRAPFDGQGFRFKDDSVVMEEHDGRKYMRIESKTSGTKLFHITKVIGGHYREDYVGQQVSGTDTDSNAIRDGLGEHVMPVSWLLFSKEWRYKGYSVMVPERTFVEEGMPWRRTCIFCHNTTPRLTTLYSELSPHGGIYQGSVSGQLLPASRTWHVVPGDRDGLADAISDEVELLGAERPKGDVEHVIDAAIRETRVHFDEKHLVELGIGCEACHNGSKEHTRDPSKHPTFEWKSDLIDVERPDPTKRPTRAELVNRTCVRCHTVLFSEYSFTWEGGLRATSPGGSQINSGEARDFILGGCATQMACPTCHDPHAGSDRTKLDALGTVSGNAVCTQCHEKYEAPQALAEHTHHAVTGEGSACLSCHMPRKNMGLANRLTRYHRIGSPDDPERVEKDRPLECALCHADRSVESLVSTMEQWWGHRYDRDKLRELYGSLDDNPLYATLARGKPHEQATAVAVLGERVGVPAVTAISHQLTNPIPLVRYFARQALERATGKPVPIDIEADDTAILRAAAEWRGGVH